MTYAVNMNRPGYLPDYEPNECETLPEAAGLALDLVDSLGNADATDTPEVYELLVDLDNGKECPVTFPIEVIHKGWCVFIAESPD